MNVTKIRRSMVFSSSAHWLADSGCDAAFDSMWLVVFPQVHHHVSRFMELVIVSTIPLDVYRNRGDPLRCVVLRGDPITRAAVPEASVYEDGNAVVGAPGWVVGADRPFGWCARCQNIRRHSTRSVPARCFSWRLGACARRSRRWVRSVVAFAVLASGQRLKKCVDLNLEQ